MTQNSSRRGVIAIIVAVSIVVLLGFTALVVDIGSLFQVQAQLEVACESAALAGASHIDGTQEGFDRAEVAARAFGTENQVRGVPVPSADLQLGFGVWNPTTKQLDPSTDVEAIDAIRVDSVPTSVSTPFAGAAWYLGLHDVTAHAIALRPPPEPVNEVECFLPMIVPACTVDAIEAAGHPWIQSFQLANDSEDTIAWAHPAGANASNVVAALQGVAAGECPVSIAIGDDVNMVNGVETTALHALEDILKDAADPWDSELWGPRPEQDGNSALTAEEYAAAGVLQGAMAVFDQGSEVCAEITYNQDRPMSEFVWGVVFDVYAGPGTHKGAQIYLDMEHDFETPGSGGGPGGNVKTRPPGLLVE